MPALIKSSPAMASGLLVALKQEVSVASASELVLRADYCCIASYAERWSAALRVGAPTPLPAPAVINYYNLLSPPALASVTTNIAQGLCYFSCQFSAPRDSTTSADGSTSPEFETTEQSIIQSQQVSGTSTSTTQKTLWNPEAGQYQQATITRNMPWTLRYSAETKTITATTASLLQVDPFLFIGPLYISEATGYSVSTVTDYRSETFVSSKGQRRFSLTGQIYYVAKQSDTISVSFNS